MDDFAAIAPPLSPPVLIEQFWGELTFIHWPVNPATIEQLYPVGTRPDVFEDGLTYIGLVPFVMRRTALARKVPLPYFGAFAETNVRLYSVDSAGRRGVVFRSLETERLAVVANGKVISRRARNDARLSIDGRPASVRRRHPGDLHRAEDVVRCRRGTYFSPSLAAHR